MKERKRIGYPEYPNRGAILFQKPEQKVETTLEVLIKFTSSFDCLHF